MRRVTDWNHARKCSGRFADHSLARHLPSPCRQIDNLKSPALLAPWGRRSPHEATCPSIASGFRGTQHARYLPSFTKTSSIRSAQSGGRAAWFGRCRLDAVICSFCATLAAEFANTNATRVPDAQPAPVVAVGPWCAGETPIPGVMTLKGDGAPCFRQNCEPMKVPFHHCASPV
jgi:hypothetical protein